jgi:hypothetical protein
MGDAQGQGRLIAPTFFLDENHCGNSHLHAVFIAASVPFEKHTDYFPRGIDDTVWIPEVARRGWAVLTADTRIRHNALERYAVKQHRLRFFYFARNDFAGIEMGEILRKALPKMIAIAKDESPPFAASISRNGEVTVRDTFSAV